MQYITGLLIGAASFLVIGLFHPIVIKGEYYFSKKIWPLFLAVGVIFCGLSLLTSGITILSCVFAVIAFSSFWGIGELFEQEQRVKKGWFPENPNRKDVRERRAAAQDSILKDAHTANPPQETSASEEKIPVESGTGKGD